MRQAFLHEQEAAAERPVDLWRESGFHSTIRWGAVFGGWLVATAVALLLYAVGLSLGIGTISAADAEIFSKKVVVISGVWMLITWLTALYFGGYFTSAASKDLAWNNVVPQAVLVWALSNILTILVGVTSVGATGITGTLAAGEAVGGIGAGLTASSSFTAGQAADISGRSVASSFQAELKRTIGRTMAGKSNDPQTLRTAAEAIDARALAAISTAFLTGGQEAAEDALAVHTSLSRAEADQVTSNLAAEAREARTKIEAANDRAAAYTVAALWTAIGISLLSLWTAIQGAKRSAARTLTSEAFAL